MKKWEIRDSEAPTPRADFVRVWMNALYYEDRRQAEGLLVVEFKDKCKGYCCLGVSTELFGYAQTRTKKPDNISGNINRIFVINGNEGVLSHGIKIFLKMNETGKFYDSGVPKARREFKRTLLDFLSKHHDAASLISGSSLAELNDSGVAFPIIALVIKKFPEAIFEKLTPEEAMYIQGTKLEGKHNLTTP